MNELITLAELAKIEHISEDAARKRASRGWYDKVKVNGKTLYRRPGIETEPEPPKPETAKYIRCTGDNVNLRAGAGTSFTAIGQAEKGTMYAVIGQTGNWYKINYQNKTAFVARAIRVL